MIRLPPGRSGRLWLRDRLVLARRAQDILDQKGRVLADELRRLEYLQGQTEAEWREALGGAESWYVRAALLGGGEVALGNVEALIPRTAQVRIPWRSSMGLVYPGETETELPGSLPLATLGRTSSLQFAALAYRRAVAAAARHAAVEQALRVVRQELAATHRRRRGIERRLIPRLEQAAADLEQRLDDQDREDMVRARWVCEREGVAAHG